MNQLGMYYLLGLALVSSIAAFTVSLVAARRAASKWANTKFTRRLRNCETELTSLSDSFEQLTNLVKRRNARENMAKARAKNGAGLSRMTDEEWRAYATKRVQQGLPIE